MMGTVRHLHIARRPQRVWRRRCRRPPLLQSARFQSLQTQKFRDVAWHMTAFDNVRWLLVRSVAPASRLAASLPSFAVAAVCAIPVPARKKAWAKMRQSGSKFDDKSVNTNSSAGKKAPATRLAAPLSSSAIAAACAAPVPAHREVDQCDIGTDSAQRHVWWAWYILKVKSSFRNKRSQLSSL